MEENVKTKGDLKVMKWWFELRNVLSKEQWGKLITYIFHYWCYDKYVDPSTIDDIALRVAWVSVSEYMKSEEYLSLE